MNEILHLINEMSPYLLLGFLLAGLMHAFIPGEYYKKYLAKPNFASVVNAAIFGIPLPLCSCGVIPTAMSLRKEGASKGAVASFLIATPQTGVDSIVATYSLMGWPFAVMRPIAALFTAIVGGWMVKEPLPIPPQKGGEIIECNACCEHEKEEHACCCEHEKEEHCCCHEHKKHDCCEHKKHDYCEHEQEEHEGFGHKLKEALEYAFLEMMEDIGKWLIVGLVVAGLITVLVPSEWFALFEGNTWASMLLVLCIAIPMYICATGSIPIAVALMLKGLTPGAALVLLMAGPACNMASILVIRKVMGTRTLITYLASIVLGSVLFGCLIDYLQFSGMLDFTSQLIASEACHESGSWFEWSCTALLVVLLINALVLPKLGLRKEHCHCHE